MGHRLSLRLLTGVAALLAAPASACLPPLPFPRLPGETDTAYDERNRLGGEAEDAEWTRSFQARSFDAAATVFLGRIVSRHPIALDGGGEGGEIAVLPLGAIKGTMPRAPVVLRDKMATDCGMVGAGTAPSQIVGAYVFVFKGLGSGEDLHDEGYAASQARDTRLLKAFREFGASHPAAPPPPPRR